MKKILSPVLFLIVSVYFMFSYGCSMTSTESGTAILKGVIYDSTTRAGLKGVTVKVMPANLTTTSLDSGVYSIPNLDGGEVIVTASATGYYGFSGKITLLSNSETKLNIPVLFTNVFVFDSLNVLSPINNTSYSSVVLDSGLLYTYDYGFKDIQLKDTVVGSDTLYCFRSGSLDIVNPGYETVFSEAFGANFNYSRTQFDTLSTYDVPGGIINPATDFPNHETASLFKFPLAKHSIFAFYLKQKFDLGVTTNRIYGLLYLDDARVAGNQILFRIAVKINKSGNNLFVRSPK